MSKEANMYPSSKTSGGTDLVLLAASKESDNKSNFCKWI